MDEQHTIQINFAKPIPLFPLDVVALLPQQVIPLHIFEPRYKQMVEHALDGAGQIAMAMYHGDSWKQQHHGRPPIKPAVCVGYIAQHQKHADGRFHILLHGICRANILHESPGSATRLYREALLEPLGTECLAGVLPTPLGHVRDRIEELLTSPALQRMRASEAVTEFIRNDEIPTVAIVEFLSFTFVNDSRLRYRLLAESDIAQRAAILIRELESLSSLIRKAMPQKDLDAPKGCSWN